MIDFGILSSSGIGAAVGAVAAYMNRKLDLAMKDKDNEQEVKRWKHELEVKDKDVEYARVEAENARQLKIVEIDGGVEIARMNTLSKSHEADKLNHEDLAAAGKLSWVFVIVEAYRRSIRPLLTTIVGGAAVVLNIYIVYHLMHLEGLTETERTNVFNMSLAWIMGQASMMFAYWFVSRGSVGK
jgi:hypothetical protein